MGASRFAAIDIGTVTCRLLVADVCEGRLTELAHGYQITNLGEDVDATGVLKPEAMERVRVAVSGFMQTIESLQPVAGDPIRVIAMATSASRDAKNAHEFVGMLQDMGIALTVIPGEREAALSFRGASKDFPGERLMVLDIGGGSTEMVVGLSGADPDIARSFNVGCRRLTERFLTSDPHAPEEVESARAFVRQTIASYLDELRQRGLWPDRLVAVAGTATSVVSVHESMAVYDSARVHGYEVSRDVLDGVYDRLSSVTLPDRQQVVGLDPGRAPVICAGLIILQTILEAMCVDSFTVSESDILQGIILDAASE